jgi:hypothetical protein
MGKFWTMVREFSLAVIACVSLLTGCAVDKYQAPAPHFTAAPGASCGTELVVLLKPVFREKSFSETVTDNAVGVFWSPEESQHIGFTQHYASTVMKNGSQLAMLAALPVNQRIGMSASGDMQTLNIDSRILVPFGRFISNNLKQAIGANGQACEDDECVRQAMQARPKARLVSVEFTKLRVAEQQRNMLLIEVEGFATASRPDATTITAPIRNVVNRSITSEGMWHSDALKAMNKIANESSSAVVEQICAAGR